MEVSNWCCFEYEIYLYFRVYANEMLRVTFIIWVYFPVSLIFFNSYIIPKGNSYFLLNCNHQRSKMTSLKTICPLLIKIFSNISEQPWMGVMIMLQVRWEKKATLQYFTCSFFVHVFTLNRDLMLIDFIKLAIQAPLEKSTILHLNTVKPIYFLST